MYIVLSIHYADSVVSLRQNVKAKQLPYFCTNCTLKLRTEVITTPFTNFAVTLEPKKPRKSCLLIPKLEEQTHIYEV